MQILLYFVCKYHILLYIYINYICNVFTGTSGGLEKCLPRC